MVGGVDDTLISDTGYGALLIEPRCRRRACPRNGRLWDTKRLRLTFMPENPSAAERLDFIAEILAEAKEFMQDGDPRATGRVAWASELADKLARDLIVDEQRKAAAVTDL